MSDYDIKVKNIKKKGFSIPNHEKIMNILKDEDEITCNIISNPIV